MRNKNLYTMKQPELGNKISEIRRQRGLTQEELVEQCNINVRTIQRIEAGEVTPRSYTIKTILEVLGVEFDEVINTEYTKGKFDAFLGINSSNIKNQINIAWIFGIVFFLISFAEYPMDFMHLEEHDSVSKPWYIIVKLISVLSFTLFMRGFIIAGNLYKNHLLSITTFLIIIINIFFVAVDVTTLFVLEEIKDIIVVSKLVVYGVLGILMGIGILLLRKHIDTIALMTGILMITASFCVVTVILSPAYLFLSIPLELMQIILLYMVAKKLSN